MRIAVVSNLYPPHHVGGYELGCRDVVNGLRQRGHEVEVVTSTFRTSDQELPAEAGVTRLLRFVGGPADEKHHKFHECRLFLQALREFGAEIVYFWNQAGLVAWLPVVANSFGYRTAFFLSDTNFVAWRVGAFLFPYTLRHPDGLASRLVRILFGRTVLVRGWPVIQDQPCHFASQFLRQYAEQAGIAVAGQGSQVVHWGIDPGLFGSRRDPARPPTRLLYVGQVIRQKGVHTAIGALALLAKEPEFDALTLDVVGGGLHPSYEKELREIVARAGLESRVKFSGIIPRSEFPQVYAEHDILIFPSEWDEPFAITPLEGMASGLPVVGTITGGSAEIFRDRETAMVFATGDAHDCARAIRELCRDDRVRDSIVQRATIEIHERYTLEKMITRIETSLKLLPS